MRDKTTKLIQSLRALSFESASFWPLECIGRGGGLAMQVTTPLSSALTRYLDLTTEQMKVTAENMANVDTPGYKTKGFDFEQEFLRQMTSPDTTAPATAQPQQVDGLVSRPDGNNVSMDREGVQLAKAQLQFKAGVQLLKNEYSMVMSAIHAEAK
jgi:flagellar basal-body rod protein FlgB